MPGGRMSTKDRLDTLRRLRSSCLEGHDGRWDCTTYEGRESFLPMVDELDQLIHDAKLDMWKEQRKERNAKKSEQRPGPAGG